ncbi:MRN complex-interacting protein isoform X2 [Octodon degus]|nr:MRN complex-interacting protein isoform X2 [Octodon degus]
MAPPQRSRVLRCCSCRLFQAHQVKRSLKWTCKACGEKQSFLRDYGEGSGADCRHHVQKLNLLLGQASELSLRKGSMSTAHPPHGLNDDTEVTVESQADTSEPGPLWIDQPGPAPVPAPSKWTQFLLLPGNSSQMDMDPPSSIQRGPRP